MRYQMEIAALAAMALSGRAGGNYTDPFLLDYPGSDDGGPLVLRQPARATFISAKPLTKRARRRLRGKGLSA